MNRRHVAALVLVGALVATAGCSFVLGQGPLEFDASPVGVSDAATQETGYELANETTIDFSQNVTRFGQTRRVEVTNHVAIYDRGVDLGPLGEQRAAAFTVFSTPKVAVLGQSFNPVGRLAPAELLARVLQDREGLSITEKTGTSETTVLGTQTTVHTFAGTQEVEGREVDVVIHVARVEHEGDYVVAVSAYPERLDGERERAMRMFGGVTHGA